MGVLGKRDESWEGGAMKSKAEALGGCAWPVNPAGREEGGAGKRSSDGEIDCGALVSKPPRGAGACDSWSGPPGTGLRPSRRAVVISAAFHLAYFDFSWMSSGSVSPSEAKTFKTERKVEAA